VVFYKKLKCSPCEKNKCPFGTNECLKSITVEEVMSAIKQITREQK
jgi:ADP-heptose:LPS heptosyltransferase